MNTSFQGLTQSEVQNRIESGLTNQFKEPSSRTYWQILRDNALTFINCMLLAIAILLFIFDKQSDAFVYITVAIINILVSLIQEVRAKQQLDTISSLTKPKTVAIRAGKELEINSHNIVLDDIIVLSSGSLVPVDGKLLSGRLDMDESLLTGESNLITKNENSELFSGTSVVAGYGLFIAQKVGLDSLANQLTSTAKTYRKVLTPVQHEINLTIRVLFLISVLLGGLSIFGSLIAQTPFTESLQIAAVVLGIIPNSLFVMINLAYAIGAVNILKKGALIQQLNAVESLSHVNVLCLDKTGTLTTNHFELSQVIDFTKQAITINPIERLSAESTEVFSTTKIEQILADFSASISDTNPTVKAISKKYPGQKHHHQLEIPFSSEYKWSGLVLDHPELKGTCVLGAPDILASHTALSTEQVEQIHTAQNQGHRVLLFCYNFEALNLRDENDKPKLPDDLNISAILIFTNELRPEAESTLKKFKDAGVELKIISGDSPNTVLALARQIKLNDQISAISGLELAKLSQIEFERAVIKNQVFGRVTPQQKMAIIQTLKARGNYVAMIGDGVNDVMPLKQANLAISMQSGSQATRNIADIVLLKDSFASLPTGLLEGQKIRNSLENIFKLYLTRITYSVLIIISASLSNLPFPFSIKQSSLLAILTTGLPTLGLTFWSYPGVTKKKSLISSALHFVVPAAVSLAVFAAILFFGFAYWQSKSLGDLALALNGSRQGDLRTVLTTFVTLCGLILVVFISIPNSDINQSSHLKTSWKPTILTGFLLATFCTIFFIPSFRTFWDLQVLEPLEIFLIVLTTLAWTTSLLFLWKARVLDWFLGNRE